MFAFPNRYFTESSRWVPLTLFCLVTAPRCELDACIVKLQQLTFFI